MYQGEPLRLRLTVKRADYRRFGNNRRAMRDAKPLHSNEHRVPLDDSAHASCDLRRPLVQQGRNRPSFRLAPYYWCC